MKKLITILLITLTIFIISCAPAEEISEEELEAELEQLSDAELEQIIKDDAALAGQATSIKAYNVKKTVVRSAAQKVLTKRSVRTICGNGVLEGNEKCDDGNQILGDGCYKCEKNVCIDTEDTIINQEFNLGTISLYKDTATGLGLLYSINDSCVNGANVKEWSCNAAGYSKHSKIKCDLPFVCDTGKCALPSCGNGNKDNLEECDDGNTDPNDGCYNCKYTGKCTTTDGDYNPEEFGEIQAWTQPTPENFVPIDLNIVETCMPQISADTVRETRCVNGNAVAVNVDCKTFGKTCEAGACV